MLFKPGTFPAQRPTGAEFWGVGVCSVGPAAPSEGTAFALLSPRSGMGHCRCVCRSGGVGVLGLALLTPLSLLCWREMNLAHACELSTALGSHPICSHGNVLRQLHLDRVLCNLGSNSIKGSIFTWKITGSCGNQIANEMESSRGS